jgi:hypothetical protein
VPDLPEARLRAEAAAFNGAPVFFRLGLDQSAGAAKPPPGAVARMRLFFLLLLILSSFVLAASLWLARRNLASGRGDRRGAGRVAAAVLAAELLKWIFSASHAPSLREFWFSFRHLAVFVLEAAIVWLLYIALEPLLRRASPSGLVSWTRLLAGRVRDPLVGRDLLLGSLMGAAYFLLFCASYSWERAAGRIPVLTPEVVANLFGAPGLIRAGVYSVVTAFMQAMGFTIVWQLFARVLRSPGRGAVALGGLLVFGLSVGNRVGAFTLFVVVGAAVMVFTISRIGLLATTALLSVFHQNLFFPISADPSAWYARESAAAFLLSLAPAAYGAWACTRRFTAAPT